MLPIRSFVVAATIFLVAPALRAPHDTDAPRHRSAPAPSRAPASSRIAFASRRDGNWEIYLTNDDGTAQTRLTKRENAEDRFPLWSPDHSKLVFASQNNGWQLWVMNTDGTNQRQLASNIIVKSTRGWSPDGKRIAFTARSDNNVDVYTADPVTGKTTRLTSHNADDRDPYWSPDGARIVFSSDRDGKRKLFVMRADGSGVRQLTPSSVTAESPAWSPDGTRISFVCGTDLCTINADGNSMRRLSHDVPVTRDIPLWSPDGNAIAFQIAEGGNYDIGVIASTGGAYRRIADSPQYDGSFNWSADSRHVAFISGRDGSDAVYTVDVDGTHARRLTTSPSLTPMWASQR